MAVDTKLTDLGTATTFSAGSWFLLVDPAVTTMDDSGTDLKVQVGNLINGLLPSQTGNSGKVLSTDGAGVLSWAVQTGGGGGSGTVTTVSVASANGFTGTVANATTTPAITITTSITGILKGNGTAISAAASGTDYEPPITAGSTAQYLKGDKSLGTLNQAAVAGLTTASSPTFAGLTVGSLAGLLKGTTGSVGVATAGTDYLTPSGSGASLTGITATQVGAEPTITAGTTAQYLRGDKSLGTLNQAAVAGLTTASSPTFAGLTVGSLSGLLKAASGVVSAATAGTDYLTTSYAGTSSIVTVGTITSGTWTGTTIAINKGGTGQTTAALAINALLPTQSTHSGQFLTTDGSVASWGSPSGAGTVTSVSVASANGLAGTVATATSTPAITLSTTVTGIVKGDGTSLSAATAWTDYAKLLVPTAPKTTTYTAAVGDFVPCDSTSGSFTVTLPTAPADQSLIGIKHTTQGSTNAITVACGGSDVFNRTSGPTSTSLSSLGRGVILQYKSSSAIWYVVARDLGTILAADVPAAVGVVTTLGDLIYGSAADTASRLAGNTTATRKFLRQAGTGSVSAAPAWDTILAADVPAAGSTTQTLYNLSGALTGNANLTVGSSGETVLGPIADPGSPASGSIWNSSTAGGISFRVNSLTRNLGGTVWKGLTAGTAVANSTTNTSLLAGISSSLGTLTLPANSLQVGMIIVPRFFGTYGATGTPNWTWQFLLGSTVLGSATAATAAGTGVGWVTDGSNGGGWIVRSISGTTATLIGLARVSPLGSGQVLLNANGTATGTPTAVTVDPTVSNAFDFKIQWGTANASNTAQFLFGWIDLNGA